jgi:hypothetical protein
MSLLEKRPETAAESLGWAIYVRDERGVWEQWQDVGILVFTSIVHLFTIKFVKGIFKA